MKHIFIINPVSGKKNVSVALRAQIRKAAQQLGYDAEVVISKHKGNCTEITQEWADWAEQHEEIVRVYACGGDGTLNEVFEGAKGRPYVEVGCVPCGSGNDFIRNFGCSEDFLDLVSLMPGKSKKIDLIQSNAGCSASICAAGLDAKVAYSIPKYRRIPLCGGAMAYYMSIAEHFFKKMGHHLAIEIDGEQFEGEYLLLALCNGRYYGSGFYAAPEAYLDDGLLDIILVKKISRLRIAKVLDIYKKGTHLLNGQIREDVADMVEFRRGKKVSIRVLDEEPIIATVDGECSPQTEIHAVVVEKCVKFVVPQKLVEKNKELIDAEYCE